MDPVSWSRSSTTRSRAICCTSRRPALRKAIEALAPPGHQEAPELPLRLRAVVVRPHDLRINDAVSAGEDDDNGDQDA